MIYASYHDFISIVNIQDLALKPPLPLELIANKILHPASIFPWDPKLQTCTCAPAGAAVLQVLNSLCIVSKPVTKHLGLTVRLFHRCGAEWLPAPLM